MPQFDVSYFSSQIFWLLVVFSFLYLIVALVISPAAEQIFRNRKVVTQENIEQAALLSKKALELKSRYEEELHKIWEQAKNLKKEALDSLNLTFEQRRAKLVAELKQAEKAALQEIQEAIKSFKLGEKEACISIAALIIEKITNHKADQKLVAECYKDV